MEADYRRFRNRLTLWTPRPRTGLADMYSSLRQRLKGSYISAQNMHYVTRPRYKFYALFALAIILLSGSLVFGIAALNGFKLRRGDRYIYYCDRPYVSPWSSRTDDPFGFPPKIWQPLHDKGQSNNESAIDPKTLQSTLSLIAANPGYAYTLIDNKTAQGLIEHSRGIYLARRHFYEDLANAEMQANVLRYHVLSEEGGVYVGANATGLRPIAEWVPPEFRREVRVVVALEPDTRDGVPSADGGIRFSDSVIAVAPRHTLMTDMISLMSSRTTFYDPERGYSSSMKYPNPTALEIANSTGALAWSEVVIDYLHARLGNRELTMKTFPSLREPVVIRDVLILPIGGFETGRSQATGAEDGGDPGSALAGQLSLDPPGEPEEKGSAAAQGHGSVKSWGDLR